MLGVSPPRRAGLPRLVANSWCATCCREGVLRCSTPSMLRTLGTRPKFASHKVPLPRRAGMPRFRRKCLTPVSVACVRTLNGSLPDGLRRSDNSTPFGASPTATSVAGIAAITWTADAVQIVAYLKSSRMSVSFPQRSIIILIDSKLPSQENHLAQL